MLYINKDLIVDQHQTQYPSWKEDFTARNLWSRWNSKIYQNIYDRFLISLSYRVKKK